MIIIALDIAPHHPLWLQNQNQNQNQRKKT
jgi:hypothetical protein